MHLAAVEAGVDGARKPLGAALSALAAFLTGVRAADALHINSSVSIGQAS